MLAKGDVVKLVVVYLDSGLARVLW